MDEISLGRVIRNARKKKRISQKELAEKANVGGPYISRIEHNRDRNPSKELLQSISRILDLDYERLLYLSTINIEPIDDGVFHRYQLEKLLNQLIEEDMFKDGLEAVTLYFNPEFANNSSLPEAAHFYRCNYDEWIASKGNPNSAQGTRKREVYKRRISFGKDFMPEDEF